MSFVGCVGNLANSGLEELMKSASAGVPKMLSGKNIPMNVRAMVGTRTKILVACCQ